MALPWSHCCCQLLIIRYKHNESRGPKIKKLCSKVINWAEYNNALRKHADTTLWFIQETIANWHLASFQKVIDICLVVWINTG